MSERDERQESDMSETTQILHRYTGAVLYQGEGSIRDVVVAAVGKGADLGRAYLGGANLRCAHLACANLGGADFQDADLRGAYLRRADLGGAYLGGANLQGAYLLGAYLRGAYLQGAYLNWHSHTLLSEILWQAADTESRKMLAAYVGRATGPCLESWQEWDYPEAEWARRELAKWVRPGDGAPEWIRSAAVLSRGD